MKFLPLGSPQASRGQERQPLAWGCSPSCCPPRPWLALLRLEPRRRLLDLEEGCRHPAIQETSPGTSGLTLGCPPLLSLPAPAPACPGVSCPALKAEADGLSPLSGARRFTSSSATPRQTSVLSDATCLRWLSVCLSGKFPCESFLGIPGVQD